MTTETMLATLKANPNTEARAVSSTQGPPMHAWTCYREGDVCHIQIATEESVGDTTVNEAFPVVPMRGDWEVVAL
jgi:hypothetical protein